MIKIKGEPVPFDVDNTLVMWGKNYDQPGPGKKEFFRPYEGDYVYLALNDLHIREIKCHFKRGFTIIVWSAAGMEWAASVIETLGLEKYVHYVQAKPIKCFDDALVAERILTNINFIPPGYLGE